MTTTTRACVPACGPIQEPWAPRTTRLPVPGRHWAGPNQYHHRAGAEIWENTRRRPLSGLVFKNLT